MSEFDTHAMYVGSPHTPNIARGNNPAMVITDGKSAPTLGRKFDGDKPRVELLIEGMPRALLEVSKVLTYGSKKYADHNWKHVEGAQRRYLGASMRHEMAYQTGELADPETGLHHIAHKICSDLFRLELLLAGRDDNGTDTERTSTADH